MQLSDSRRRRKLFAPAAQRLKTKILVGPDENYGAVEPDLDSYPDLSLSELNDKKNTISKYSEAYKRRNYCLREEY